MFIDEIKIYARAGHGGKGCVAFSREKYRPKKKENSANRELCFREKRQVYRNKAPVGRGIR